MTDAVSLRSLRDRPYELLSELERRGRAVSAQVAQEGAAGREWVGVALRMAGELFDHMIEKADPCGNRINPGPVEVEVHRDRRLVRLPADRSRAHEARYSDPLSARNVLTAKRHAFTKGV